MRTKSGLLILAFLLAGSAAVAQKVFRVKYESRAGWRNPEKQHLLL